MTRQTYAVLLSVMAGLAAGAMLAAAEPAPAIATTTTTLTGTYQGVWLELSGDALCRAGGSSKVGKTANPKPPPSQEAVRVFLGFRAGRMVTGWLATSVDPERNTDQHLAFDTPGLVLAADGRITGSTTGRAIWLTNRDKVVKETPTLTWTIDASPASGGYSGTWTAVLAGKTIPGGTASGALTGRTLAAAGLDPTASWPAWRGPDDTLATAAKTPLIETAAAMRPVWRSEEDLAAGFSNGPDFRYLWKVIQSGSCRGAVTPVIDRNTIYISYYQASRESRLIVEHRYLQHIFGPAQGNRDALEALKKAALADPSTKPPLVTEADMRRQLSERGYNTIEQEAFADAFRTYSDEVVAAIDAGTGRTLWRTVTTQCSQNIQTHKMRGINPNPLIVAGPKPGQRSLVVLSYANHLACYDPDTGVQRWRVADVQRISDEDSFANDPSPVVVPGPDGPVVVATRDRTSLVAWDLTSGIEVWRAKLSITAHMASGPLLAFRLSDGRTAVVKTMSTTGEVVVLDSITGKPLWERTLNFGSKMGKDEEDCHNSPIRVGDCLIGFALDVAARAKSAKDVVPGHLISLRLAPTGMTEVWRTPVNINQSAQCTVLGDTLTLIGAGQIHRIDAVSGRIKQSVPVETSAGANAIRHGDRLLVLLDGAHGRCEFNLFSMAGDELRNGDAGKKFAPPNLADGSYHGNYISYPMVDGRLFLRGGGGLYCYDLRK